MAELTEFLGLHMKDPVADAGDTFNIKTMLNDNFRKIDGFCAGTARIRTGSYVGTGTYGYSNPNTITITPNTKMVLIQHDSGDYAGMAFRDCGLTNLTDGNGACRASWSEDLLSWYYDGTNGAGRQLNYEGDTYHYMLFE